MLVDREEKIAAAKLAMQHREFSDGVFGDASSAEEEQAEAPRTFRQPTMIPQPHMRRR